MTLTDSQLTALRIAIAEDQGHKHFGYTRNILTDEDEAIYAHKDSDGPVFAPNYPADRNAIVEAIVGRFQSEHDIEEFARALWQLTRGSVPFRYTNYGDVFALATASAQTLSLTYAKAANLNIELPMTSEQEKGIRTLSNFFAKAANQRP